MKRVMYVGSQQDIVEKKKLGVYSSKETFICRMKGNIT